LFKQISLAIASAALLVGAASVVSTPAPSTPDVAAMRDYVAKNRAYSPAARAEALRRVEALAALSGDPARFELEAAAIAALADNGHSVLLPPQWASRYPRSPVRFGLFADGLFVIAAPADQAGLIGRRVVELNGRPWQAVRQAYARYQGGEQGFRDQFVTLFMETPALLHAAGLSEDPAGLALLLEAENGERTREAVAARLAPFEGEAALLGRPQLLEASASLPADARPLYLQNPDEAWRLAYSDAVNGAYIQLKSTAGDGIGPFLEATLAELGRRRPRNIVVDLRFNLGGDLTLARDFMEKLPPLAAGGRIYAITSGRTFSAAISSLGYLRQAAGDRLTIVGEPIGDRLEFWAEGDLLRLPGVGAMLLYATERHNYMTGCPEPDCHAAIRDHPIRVATLQPAHLRRLPRRARSGDGGDHRRHKRSRRPLKSVEIREGGRVVGASRRRQLQLDEAPGHQIGPGIRRGERRSLGRGKVEPAIISGLADHQHHLLAALARDRQRLLDQPPADAAPLVFRHDRYRRQAERAEGAAVALDPHPAHHYVADDPPLILGDQRELAIAVCAQPLDQIGLGRGRKGGEQDRPDRRGVGARFASEPHTVAMSGASSAFMPTTL
jgi:hypothetical protein